MIKLLKTNVLVNKRLLNLPRYYTDRLGLRNKELQNVKDFHARIHQAKNEIEDMENFKQEMKKQKSHNSELTEISKEILLLDSAIENIHQEYIDFLESDILPFIERNSTFGRTGLIFKGCRMKTRGVIGGSESDGFAKRLSEFYQKFSSKCYDKSDWSFSKDHSISQKRTRLAQPNNVYQVDVEDDESNVFDDLRMESGLHVLKTRELRNVKESTKMRGTGGFTFTAVVSLDPMFKGTLKTGIFAESQEKVCDFITSSGDFSVNNDLMKITETKFLIPVIYKPLKMHFEVPHLNATSRTDSILMECLNIQNEIGNSLFKKHQQEFFGEFLYTNNTSKVRQYSEINNFVSDYRLEGDVWRGSVDEFLTETDELSFFMGKLKDVNPVRKCKLQGLLDRMND